MAYRTKGTANRKEWRWAALVTLALMVISILPYLIAWAVTPEEMHFTGLLINPQDGHSYIAKMRQGLNGSWSFRLPYTPEPHGGAPMYLFYLLLGHLSRWTGLPLIVVYHGARLAGSAAMLLALYALARRLSDDVGERRAMLLLTALGSGLGWLAGLCGVRTADLWVTEAFPVYAMLANAHFPLAIGLMAGIANCQLRMAHGRGHEWLWGLGMIVTALALGAIQPFGLAAAFGGLGVMLAAQVVRARVIPWRTVAWITVAGAVALVYPLYMQWSLHADPVLAVWNAQNVTPSPPLWDWALSYGLVLVLATLGAISAARRRAEGDWLALGWVLVTLVGMYVPLPLQRRLSLGLGVPMGLLAGMGWWRVVRPRIAARRRGRLQGLVVTFCTLTPIFLVTVTLVAALAGTSWFYLSDGEWAALEWLRKDGDPERVVLCAPQMGLFVPAWAGQRVVYGHPFATVDAERREAQVKAFWGGEMDAAERESFLRENRVGYVLIGPREMGIGDGSAALTTGWGLGIEGWRLVFEAGDARIYEVAR